MLRLGAALIAAADALPETEAKTTDELVPLAKSGIELKAVKALIRSGELPHRKLGRVTYVLRSDLIRLVKNAPAKPVKAPPSTIDPGEYLRQIAGAKR